MTTLMLVPSPLEFERLTTGRQLNPETGPLQVYRSGQHLWAVCGIGPAAGISTAILVARYKPDRVILIGIAGAARQTNLALGDLVQARTECFGDLGYCQDGKPVTLMDMGLPLLPGHHSTSQDPFPLTLLNGDLQCHDFVTVSTVTSDQQRADSLWQRFGAGIENMEGAGVALACSLTDTRCSEVRAISNWTGPRDPSQWLIKESLEHLDQWLTKFLEGA